MTIMARIVVADDEPYITDLLGTALRYEGFDVCEAHSGTGALGAARDFAPDLLLLDIMLPDIDGFEVTRRLRRDGMTLPILFLTAKDGTEDKVTGLTIGGDDYVSKPFSLEEVIARVRALLRRSTQPGDQPHRLSFEGIVMDEDTREVWREGEAVQLTTTEFNLLRYLLLNPRRVLSKAQILDHVWQYDFGGDSNVVETYISYLRKKLDPLGVPLIHTIRGVGYSLRLPN
jgi:two-component system OmpR family response regulator